MPAQSWGGSTWTPRTVELKGFCWYGDRYSHGVSVQWATDFLYKMRDTMAEETSEKKHWQRSGAANRYAFNFKLVFVMRGSGGSSADRETAYIVK